MTTNNSLSFSLYESRSNRIIAVHKVKVKLHLLKNLNILLAENLSETEYNLAKEAKEALESQLKLIWVMKHE